MLVGTPIGDARYVSEALRSALAGADVIAAEDTRKFADLCRRAGIGPLAGRVRSYFEGNEAARTGELVKALAGGATVALVTDAGMPSVSDPGFRLVRAAIEAGVVVSAVPGPSAVLTALALSGLNTDRFCFEGFLPRRPGPRRSRLEALGNEERTMVFFEAPHRLGSFLADAVAAFGADRRGAICREMTKTYEEVIRGTVAELAQWATGEVRGEVTVVIAGAEPAAPDMAVLVEEVRSLIASGERPPAAAAEVASRWGIDRRALYDAARG